MHALPFYLALISFAAQLRDGTVVVLENSNPFVEAYTRSEVTHVAMIVNVDGEPWVFEATPSEVRKLRYAGYVREIGQINRGRRESNRIRMRLYQPSEAYSDQQLTALRTCLDSQLGRRYSVKGILRHKPVPGIHCADLVSTALMSTGRYQFDRTYSVTPAEVATRIRPLHDPPLDVELPLERPEGTWCERSWNWWAGVFAWCGWASWETATFAF